MARVHLAVPEVQEEVRTLLVQPLLMQAVAVLQLLTLQEQLVQVALAVVVTVAQSRVVLVLQEQLIVVVEQALPAVEAAVLAS